MIKSESDKKKMQLVALYLELRHLVTIIVVWLQQTQHFRDALCTYLLDVLWGQPIKQNQVASTSELHQNQRNNLLFFQIVPCHFCRASEVQT